jgi:mannose-6-phosphate isomerase-like protein (cupin superfamily)
MVHCTLQSGQVTQAVRHRTVEEMWFCVAGAGQMWRRFSPTPTPTPGPTPTPTPTPPTEARSESPSEEVVDLEPGVALSIPLGVAFQFRASGSRPLEVVIATIPSWPGEDEAVPVEGVWEATPR